MTTITVKPKKGLKVRDPDTGNHLPDGGAKKRQTAYWLRAARRGDVTIKAAKKPAAKKQAAKKPAAKEEAKSAKEAVKEVTDKVTS